MNKMSAGGTVLPTSVTAISDNIRTFWRGLTFLFTLAPRLALVYILQMCVNGICPVFQVWLIKLIVDVLTTPGAHSGNMVLILAGLYALALIIPAVVEPFDGVLIASLQRRAVAAIDRQVMSANERMVDLVTVETPAFQDEVRLLREAVMPLYWTWVRLRNGVRMALTLLGLLVLLGHLHPLFPLVLAVVSIPHLRAEWRNYQHHWESLVDRSRAAREMDYCARIVTEPSAAKEMRVFGLGDFFLRRFRERAEEGLAEVNRIRFAQLRYVTLCGGLYILVLGGGFWYVATRAAAGHLTPGDIALYLNAVIEAQGRLSILAGATGEINQSILHIRRLFAFLDSARPGITLPTSGQGKPVPEQSGSELQHLHFTYPGSSSAVLQDVNALLPAGKLTALVGENGAGKSTLVKLLTRMYDPTGGAILLAGTPLAAYDLAALRGSIAVVPQDFSRFALSLRENIALGTFAAQQEEVSLVQAARWSGVDEVVAKLPAGYETALTRRFEGGVELSGGEWQKVALARGIIRNASLVILDEPTAALDAEAEARLFEHVRQFVKGKTALVISHRFSTVRQADQILVLEDGQVRETGSHSELLASRGRYAALYEMQAGRYRSDAL